MLLGLTGACCSGKNAVAEILKDNGWDCIDVDRLGHLALQQVCPQLVDSFGPEALNPDGTPNRRWLGNLVFADPAKLAVLEALVHPKMYELTDQSIGASQSAGRPVCLNAAILYKMPHARHCNRIIEVHACLLLRLVRACRRDRLPLSAALARMYSQKSLLGRRVQFGKQVLHVSNNLSYNNLRQKINTISDRLTAQNSPARRTDRP